MSFNSRTGGRSQPPVSRDNKSNINVQPVGFRDLVGVAAGALKRIPSHKSGMRRYD